MFVQRMVKVLGVSMNIIILYLCLYFDRQVYIIQHDNNLTRSPGYQLVFLSGAHSDQPDRPVANRELAALHFNHFFHIVHPQIRRFTVD